MTEQEIQILESMLSRIEKCESVSRSLMESNKALIRSNQVLSEALEALRNEYEHFSENVVYECNDPILHNGHLFYPTVLSVNETLNDLLSGGKSLCRFGDGEFACINGNLRASFTTRYDRRLAERLKEVLESCDDGIMIAIAANYGELSDYAPSSRREIRHYMTPMIRSEHKELLDENRRYYNAYITRPYMYYYDDPDGMEAYWNRISKLWAGRDIVIIEGTNTGTGVGNDLLKDSETVSRIIAPARDAFDEYEQILKSALDQPADRLYLCSLGPAATVLAYDLAKSGRQAVDIGHLDIEYEWWKRGEYRCLIPGKYVNEVSGGTDPVPISDEIYESQIVSRIESTV